MLQIVHITKRYHYQKVLDDISLDLPKTGMIAIVGPSRFSGRYQMARKKCQKTFIALFSKAYWFYFSAISFDYVAFCSSKYNDVTIFPKGWWRRKFRY